MSRFDERLRESLQDPEFVEAFAEAKAEINLLLALDEARMLREVPKQELAVRMGRQRESVSRTLSVRGANPTLRTIVAVLESLGMTAEIVLRPAHKGELPITIAEVQ
jgi:DNA-binding phage protein